MKSTVDQIRRRFDADVERFSVLETGRSATMDAPLVLDLLSEAAAAVTPRATSILDVGCGAGNYTLQFLTRLANMNCTLVDLSQPMLDRARQRVSAATSGTIATIQGDIREIELGEGQFDVITAAAVLHHLRDDGQWRAVFARFHRALRPGGSLWISDLIEHSSSAIQQVMQRRYGQYLANLKGEAYRDTVFAYVEQEDTPKPLMFQIDLLREAGFKSVEILHKNSLFAAFGAMK